MFKLPDVLVKITFAIMVVPVSLIHLVVQLAGALQNTKANSAKYVSNFILYGVIIIVIKLGSSDVKKTIMNQTWLKIAYLSVWVFCSGLFVCLFVFFL